MAKTPKPLPSLEWLAPRLKLSRALALFSYFALLILLLVWNLAFADLHGARIWVVLSIQLLPLLLLAPGLLLGNANDGRYFQVEQNGNLYMPGFNVVNGVATFTGRAIYDAGGGNRLEIDSAQIRVYAGGVLRVIMGVGF